MGITRKQSDKSRMWDRMWCILQCPSNLHSSGSCIRKYDLVLGYEGLQRPDFHMQWVNSSTHLLNQKLI